jgi:hypothetical protein
MQSKGAVDWPSLSSRAFTLFSPHARWFLHQTTTSTRVPVEDPSQVIVYHAFSHAETPHVSQFFSPSLTKSNTSIWCGLNRCLISAAPSWCFEVSMIVLTIFALLTNADLCFNPRRAYNPG